MTPSEKAKKLWEYYYFFVSKTNDKSVKYICKQCALITVDEMIDQLPFTDLNTYIGKWCEQQRNYLNEVKQEIIKI